MRWLCWLLLLGAVGCRTSRVERTASLLQHTAQQLQWEAQQSYSLEQVWEYRKDTLVRLTQKVVSQKAQQQKQTEQRTDSVVAVEQKRLEVTPMPLPRPVAQWGCVRLCLALILVLLLAMLFLWRWFKRWLRRLFPWW